MGKTQKSIFEWMQEVPRNLVYLLLIIALVFPLFYPVGLPITKMPETVVAYDLVEGLKNSPGSVIFFHWDAHPNGWMEVGWGGKTLMYHAFRLPVKIIFFSLYSEGMQYFDTAVAQLKPADREYGRDYVYLGYLAGGEAAAAKIADDFHSVYSSDYLGTPLNQIPNAEWLQDVTGAADAPMLISLVHFDGGTWIRNQWCGRYPDLLWVMTQDQSGYANNVPFYKAGIIDGMVVSTRGSAEYDLILGRKSITIAQLDSQSMACLLTLVLIVIGNIGYYAEKSRKKTQEVLT